MRASGTPGPRPNLDLARAVGAELARAGTTGAEVTKELLAQKEPYLVRVGLMALAARASDPRDRSGAFETLHDHADAPAKEARDAVITALTAVVVARGDEVVPSLARMTDGFLHAYVALEALTARTALDRISQPEELLARLGETFDLADDSSRSDKRAQGVRLVREGLPDQIARVGRGAPDARATGDARRHVRDAGRAPQTLARRRGSHTPPRDLRGPRTEAARPDAHHQGHATAR